MADIGEQRIKAAWEMANHIDGLLSRGDLKGLPLLKRDIDEINASPVVERRQLELPVGMVKLKFLSSFWRWLTQR
jgi:hypothetical protein